MLSPEVIAELESARAELTKRLKGEPSGAAEGRLPNGGTGASRVAGFKRGADELIKFEGGDYNEKAILRETHFECFHCGQPWLDTPLIREQLDQSSHYLPVRADALEKNIGFNFPQWINRRLPWGPMMLEKLKAQRTLAETGNAEPLKIWWQKVAARTWDSDAISRKNMEISVGSYETDPNKLMPDSHCRQTTVDCGKAEDAGPDENRIGLLWFDIWEWDKRGNGIQLSYGCLRTATDGTGLTCWDLLDAQNRYWKVPNSRVMIDASWMPSQVEEAAIRHFELVPPASVDDKGHPQRQTPYCWKLIAGAGEGRRMSIGGKGMSYLLNMLPGLRTAHDKAGRLWRMYLWKLTWSNLNFEKQLDSILSKGVSVQLTFLPREKCIVVDKDLKPSAELLAWSQARCRDTEKPVKFASYSSQVNSRYYSEKSRKYEDWDKHSRPTEFRDTLLEQLAGVAKDGLLGHVSQEEAEKT